MFYWIKNWKVVISGENKIDWFKVDKWIESKIENWVYENWKIIPYKESKEYKKRIQKMLEQQAEQYKKQWYNVEIKDWKVEIIKDEKWLEVEIQKINKRFDDTIEEYTAKYPIYEKMTWAIKQQEAQKVMNWETSSYLEDLVRKRLQVEGKTDDEINEILQDEVKKFAEIILEKAKEYADLYSKLEAEKDKKIQELKMQLNIQ